MNIYTPAIRLCMICMLAAALSTCTHSGVQVQKAGQRTQTVKDHDPDNLLPQAIREFRVSPLDVLRVEVWQSSETSGPFRFDTHNSVRISLAFDSAGWAEVECRGMHGWVPAESLTAGSSPDNSSAQASASQRFVNATSLKLRDAPGGTMTGGLPGGASVEILEEKQGWARITNGTLSGWVKAQYLSAAPSAAPRESKKTLRPASLRSAPGGPVTAELAKGEQVRVLRAQQGYRIMAGDWLRINFLSDPQLDFEATVRPDGKITLPRVCELMAQGSTPVELGEAISQAYSKQINAPETTVTVVQANTTQIELIGGEFTVRPDGKITLPVLGDFTAGGRTPESVAEQISAAASARFQNNIRARAIITDFIPRSLLQFDRTVTVLPDGTIILPETGLLSAKDASLPELRARIKQRLQKKYSNQVDVSISLMESLNRVVYVSGEVKSAGSYPLTDAMTVMRALMQAGGTTHEGDLAEVVLIHYTGAGSVTVYTTNLQEVIDENKALQDMLLSPQDIIFVPRKGISQANLFVEQYITNMLPFSRNVSYNYNKNRNSDTKTPSYNPTTP